MSDFKQDKEAKEFVKRWADRSSEKEFSQKFWIDLLSNVYGVEQVTEYLEFDITREEIKIYHVESEIKNGNIGYISLYTFDTGSAEELQKAITDLEAKGAKKFILDLRYNGGGNSSVIKPLINFLKETTMVTCMTSSTCLFYCY